MYRQNETNAYFYYICTHVGVSTYLMLIYLLFNEPTGLEIGITIWFRIKIIIIYNVNILEGQKLEYFTIFPITKCVFINFLLKST